MSLRPEIGCFVQFNGDYSGLVVVNFSAGAAMDLYRSYMLVMGMPESELAKDATSAEVVDTMGEMTNQFMGKAMQMVEGIDDQIHRVFQNLRAVTVAANSNIDGIVKLNIFLTDLKHFAKVNEIMATYFPQPYPARAAVGVASLPRNALVEADGVMFIQD